MCCCGKKKGMARDIAALRKKPYFYDCFHNMGMTLNVTGIIAGGMGLIFILSIFSRFPTTLRPAGVGMYGEHDNIKFFLKSVPMELGSVVRAFHMIGTTTCVSGLLFLVYILFFRSYYRPESSMKMMPALCNLASLVCMVISASVWTMGTSELLRNPIYVALLWMVAALFLLPAVLTLALICSKRLSEIYDEEISGGEDVSRIKFKANLQTADANK